MAERRISDPARPGPQGGIAKVLYRITVMDKEFESEIWIPSKNGVGQPPRTLSCPECGADVRRRPGNRYVCDCGAETTLDLTPLEHRK